MITKEDYVEWTPTRLVDPRASNVEQLIHGMEHIIASEGPVIASRVFQIFSKAGGLSRIYVETKKSFHRALQTALGHESVALAFVCADERPGYSLCVEGCGRVAAARVEKELERNPYYAQARALGQLQALRTRLLPDGFRHRLVEHLGMKEGGFKPRALYGRGILESVLP